MKFRLLQFLAIVSVSLYLVPTGAHFFELTSKMALSPAEYMTVQRIYAGWSLFGIVIAVALLATLMHTVLVRADRTVFVLSLAAFLGLVATQAIFWAFTYPMNVASQNWTIVPEPFGTARRQWEYSHAASAVLTFASLLAIVLSALMFQDSDGRQRIAP
ncbi:MAG: hypothetical protein HY246_01915 [Proteobacteria bacterium]|nr:hypothetical protein [Pseudomonadota bacterium]